MILSIPNSTSGGLSGVSQPTTRTLEIGCQRQLKLLLF